MTRPHTRQFQIWTGPALTFADKEREGGVRRNSKCTRWCLLRNLGQVQSAGDGMPYLQIDMGLRDSEILVPGMKNLYHQLRPIGLETLRASLATCVTLFCPAFPFWAPLSGHLHSVLLFPRSHITNTEASERTWPLPPSPHGPSSPHAHTWDSLCGPAQWLRD